MPYSSVPEKGIYRFNGSKLRKQEKAGVSNKNAFDCLTLKYVHVGVSSNTQVELIEVSKSKAPPPL